MLSKERSTKKSKCPSRIADQPREILLINTKHKAHKAHKSTDQTIQTAAHVDHANSTPDNQIINKYPINFTLCLIDDTNQVNLTVHRDILLSAGGEYFEKLFVELGELPPSGKILVNVPNANVAHDIIMGFHIRFTNLSKLPKWLHILESIRCANSWGLNDMIDRLARDLVVPRLGFEMFVRIVKTVPWNILVCGSIAECIIRNLPENYDLAKIPRELDVIIVKSLQDTKFIRELDPAKYGFKKLRNIFRLVSYDPVVTNLTIKSVAENYDLDEFPQEFISMVIRALKSHDLIEDLCITDMPDIGFQILNRILKLVADDTAATKLILTYVVLCLSKNYCQVKFFGTLNMDSAITIKANPLEKYDLAHLPIDLVTQVVESIACYNIIYWDGSDSLLVENDISEYTEYTKQKFYDVAHVSFAPQGEGLVIVRTKPIICSGVDHNAIDIMTMEDVENCDILDCVWSNQNLPNWHNNNTSINIAYSHGGKYIAMAINSTIYIINVKNKMTNRVLNLCVNGIYVYAQANSYWISIRISQDINCICYSPNCDQIAFANHSRVQILDISPLRQINHPQIPKLCTTIQHDNVTCICYSPNSLQLISGDSTGRIMISNAKTGSLIQQLILGIGPIKQIGYSQNYRQFACVSGDGYVRLWNYSDWRMTHVLAGPPSVNPTCISYSSNSRHIVIGYDCGHIHVRNTTSGTVVQQYSMQKPIRSIGCVNNSYHATLSRLDRMVMSV